MTADDIQRLANDLGNKDASRRTAAAETLMQLGSEAFPAAAALVEACGYEDTREACAETLENLGSPSADQLPRLADLVGVQQLDVSYWAATLLGRAGVVAAAYVEPLERAAVDQSHPLAARERAVWALGKIGPAAGKAVASLRGLAENAPSPRLGQLAAASLRSIVD